MSRSIWRISAGVTSYSRANRSTSGCICVSISSPVMPQMAANSGSREMLVMLLSVEKMLSCENLVMPVMKQKRIIASLAFRHW